MSEKINQGDTIEILPGASLFVKPTSLPNTFGRYMEFLSFLGISHGKKNLLVSPISAEVPIPMMQLTSCSVGVQRPIESMKVLRLDAQGVYKLGEREGKFFIF